MFIDGRSVPKDSALDADICIVGGGAAGVTLARSLAGSGLQLLLLESGAFELEPDIQELYDGAVVGHPYPLAEFRLRFLGGSTNHWGGRILPMKPRDFEPRPWVPHSGWPIRFADVEPHYAAARGVCQIGESSFDIGKVTGPDGTRPLELDDKVLQSVVAYKSPISFGTAYRDAMNNQDGLRVCLHGSVVHVAADTTASAIDHVDVRTLDGNAFKVTARVFVIACGGIENARLLLASDDVSKVGIGNQNDLVGRYFMELPSVYRGRVLLVGHPAKFGFYDPRPLDPAVENGPTVEGALELAAEAEAAEQLGRMHIELHPRHSWIRSPGTLAALDAGSRYAELGVSGLAEDVGVIVSNLVGVAGDLGGRAVHGMPGPAERFVMYQPSFNVEQLPNPDSRVRLGDERDAFGMRRIVLDWRVTDREVDAVHRGRAILARELGRAQLGRVWIPPEDTSQAVWEQVEGGMHHKGTTRMSADPKQGVVDADCRVHGMANLYMAGSSVFPTGSCVNPTFTIVALALRLAEHLKTQRPQSG